MGIAVWRVTINPKNVSFFRECRFSLRKNVSFQRSSEHVVIRRVARLSRIDVWTPWARHGVPTSPPRRRRARRRLGGLVGTPWRAQGVQTSMRDSRATRRMTTCSELRWKLTFFLSENRHSLKNDTFFGFIVTRQTAMPIQIVPRFCARGYGRFEKLLYCCQNPSR